MVKFIQQYAVTLHENKIILNYFMLIKLLLKIFLVLCNCMEKSSNFVYKINKQRVPFTKISILKASLKMYIDFKLPFETPKTA